MNSEPQAERTAKLHEDILHDTHETYLQMRADGKLTNADATDVKSLLERAKSAKSPREAIMYTNAAACILNLEQSYNRDSTENSPPFDDQPTPGASLFIRIRYDVMLAQGDSEAERVRT